MHRPRSLYLQNDEHVLEAEDWKTDIELLSVLVIFAVILQAPSAVIRSYFVSGFFRISMKLINYERKGKLRT